MKILQLITGPGAGGAEVYVKDLAIAMTHKGHELHIGFWGYAKDFGRNKDFEDNYLKELEKNNIKYFFIGYESRKKPWIGIFKVKKYINETNIDIYHSHFLYGTLFGLLTKKPIIYTHHNIKFQTKKIIFIFFDKLINRYIGISNICSDALRNYTQKKITTIMNGVNIKKFPKNISIRKFKNNLDFLAVGRIHPQKNYFLLVDSIALLPLNIQDKIKISIAGEGSNKDLENLKNYIKNKKLSKTIHLIGNQNNIPELMSKFDIFIMTSAWEGLPISLIEASISGLPCIVTDVGGCSEIINTCINGIIVEPDNAQKMADAIVSYFENPEKISEHSKNGMKYSNVYSIETSTKKHLELYQEIYKNNSF
ncbi:glycosyl transferase group 1 [Advenella faeciporci]|uniref:Glycosyl transferase group 1 n=1 Tax=Advenella faeciporci TaxID=797535 RepID=A0A918JPZ0_9BURK|nr:glycosyltransferase family 4 protein [Advenella faeciporci]GGW93388.1 glycosyl transferase group 1 [Advenella faeciporci]